MKLRSLLIVLVLPYSIALADSDISNAITISGFGTLAGARTNTDNAQFARPNQVSGVNTTWGDGVDSNFGIQATAKVNDMYSFTAQGLVRKNVTNQFGGELAWAFAKAKLSDEFSVRVGRVGFPVFMISDYRNVGYANTMIRPPVELYGQVPIESVDGADVVVQKMFGDTTVTGQLAAGSTNLDVASGFSVRIRDMIGLSLTAENGPFTFRFGRLNLKFTTNDFVPLNTLVAGLNQAGFGSVASNLQAQNATGTFTSLGMGVDWKNILVQTEYAKRKTTSLIYADSTAWYTMVGYRMGKFTPYINHASATQDSPRTVASMPTSGPYLPLTQGVNAFTANGVLQTSNSLGLRWDFSKSAALKVQIDRVSPQGEGSFVNVLPGFTGPVTVFAAGIDFVF